MRQMSERALRLAIKQATDESCHQACEAQRLKIQLHKLIETKQKRRATQARDGED